MIKFCKHCGKPFQTDYPSKLYCNKTCAKKAAYNREESFYEFPHDVNQTPIYEFECAWCGKTVKVYSNYDQRNRFCCGAHRKKFHSKKLAMKLRGDNLGMSGGMSLGSLIKREARDLK